MPLIFNPLAGEFNAYKAVTDATPLTVKLTGSTTTRSLSTRYAETVNVLDFGAVANDPTKDVINAAAFQAAFNAAYDSTLTGIFQHRKVRVPSGKYYVTTIRTGSSSSSNGFWLDGDAGAAIVGTVANNHVIQVVGSDTIISNILVDRNGTQVGTGNGIHVFNSLGYTQGRVRLDRVEVQNQPQDGLYADKSELLGANFCVFNDNARYGINCNDDSLLSQGFGGLFTNCRAIHNGSTGVRLDSQDVYTFINLQALQNDQNNATGSQVTCLGASTYGHTFITPDCENNNTGIGYGIRMTGTSHNIIGGTFVDLTYGIYLNAAKDCNISKPRFFHKATPGTGLAGVLVDSSSNNNYISSTFGSGYSNSVSYSGGNSGNIQQNNERFELHGSRIMGTAVALDLNSATPASTFGNVFISTNTLATSITNFTGGVYCQTITIIVKDALTTFVNGSGLQLAGSVNFTATNGTTISFVYDGTSKWYETSRMIP